MSNTRLTTQHRKHPAGANSIGSQGVAHKSTGGILNSFPQPVDPVGNASHRLTNHTVALPLFVFVLATWWTGVRAHGGHIGSEFKVSKRFFIETVFRPQSSPIWGCG